ncbi:MAG: hypothetical protein P4N59_21035 [Negativicutes bacterium]|nr:hypothetical protein [Negativicutes bacterium]
MLMINDPDAEEQQTIERIVVVYEKLHQSGLDPATHKAVSEELSHVIDLLQLRRELRKHRLGTYSHSTFVQP